MTGAELKNLIPDDAVVYLDGEELLADDCEVDQDGDFLIFSPVDETPDDDEDDTQG